MAADQLSRRGGTPVAVAGHAGQYVFDPTGRQIPLFLPPAPDLGDFSGSRASLREWQVPGPLTSSLETAINDSGTSPPPPFGPLSRRRCPACLRPRGGLAASVDLAGDRPVRRDARFPRRAAHGRLPVRVLIHDRRRPLRPRPAREPPGRRRHGEGRDRRDGPRCSARRGRVDRNGHDRRLQRPRFPHLRDARRRRLERRTDRLAARARAGPSMRPVLRPAAGTRAVGLHRGRRGTARPRRTHRLRMRHRAARLVRHGAHYRMHDRPGHRRTRIAATRHGGRRRPPRPVPDLRRGRSWRPGGRERNDPPAPRGPLHPRPGPYAFRRGGRDAHDHRQHRPGPSGDDRHCLYRRGRLRPVAAGHEPPLGRPAVGGAARRRCREGRVQPCARTGPGRWRGSSPASRAGSSPGSTRS